MTSLTTKLHYTYHEDGEFESEAQRTLQETTELVEQFPWAKVRKSFVVGLFAPSVTIQNEEGAYLRLSLYYHDKFVLYFFDTRHKLYKLPLAQLADAYPYITSFYNDPVFGAGDFKQEHTTFQNNLLQFATSDFRYTQRPGKTFLFFMLTSFPSLCLIGIVVWGLIRLAATMPLAGAAFLALLLIFPAIMLIFFFNHYNYTRNKVLILSKGNDTFYFGPTAAPICYNKKDIATITNKVARGDRNPLALLNLTTITFKDGTEIYIPNMLMSFYMQQGKFPELAIGSQYGLPYIPRGA